MSMTPDRRMVEKIQDYDKDLFVKWNNRRGFFELWRKQTVGSVLITPITESIYNGGEIRFTPLDERILTWLFKADSWKHGGAREHAMKQSAAWKHVDKHQYQKTCEDFKDRAKDLWCHVNNKYVTNQKGNIEKRGRYPSFKNAKTVEKWVRPDSGARTSGRLFARTNANAKKLDYKP